MVEAIFFIIKFMNLNIHLTFAVKENIAKMEKFIQYQKDILVVLMKICMVRHLV